MGAGDAALGARSGAGSVRRHRRRGACMARHARNALNGVNSEHAFAAPNGHLQLHCITIKLKIIL